MYIIVSHVEISKCSHVIMMHACFDVLSTVLAVAPACDVVGLDCGFGCSIERERR